ncbi:DUF1613-domain-containing protein [Panus rudis PR-1116 ss-1]|nr:DUF1613-domain-containing protein [Panus rudis PR-1116 ss-1]
MSTQSPFQNQNPPSRPRFSPVPCTSTNSATSGIPPLQSSSPSNVGIWRYFTSFQYLRGTHAAAAKVEDEPKSKSWVPMIQCSADFPLELFEVAITQLIHHPEWNSTLILRSEIISEQSSTWNFPPILPHLENLTIVRNIHRKLLARRPGRDSNLEQYCTLYAPRSTGILNWKLSSQVNTLVLTPIVEKGTELPYYHPRVSHLAFRYIPTAGPDGGDGLLRIEVVPLPDTPTDIDSRLYRTCLALLETLHRYGWGAMGKYKKRVMHDSIISREEYQDLYLIMRERHKHLVGNWQEKTDPLKHVFEDIGIATFLMLLWRDMYKEERPLFAERATVWNRCLRPFRFALQLFRDFQSYLVALFSRLSLRSRKIEAPQPEGEFWKSWARPKAGFVDLGCGNGLLTHILLSEGYEGHGLDVRARQSWTHYPRTTQSHLHVSPLDPLDTTAPGNELLKDGVFLIGNHADELTPWVPVLGTLCNATGYLNVPCCSWGFDARYDRGIHRNFNVYRDGGWKGEKEEDELNLEMFAESLNLGGDAGVTSGYSAYRIWLATLSYHCGWKVETEVLRIPSTRAWALIGRAHTWDDPEGAQQARQHAQDIIKSIRERGLFKTRRPEGKAGDH